MPALLYFSENFSTTLNVPSGINSTQTTGIILTSVAGLDPAGGILCLDWANPLNTSTAEYIEYGGISGNELSGVVRGAEGVSGKSHNNGATVTAVVSKSHLNRVNDKLKGIDTGVVLTSPVLNTGVSGTAIDTDGTLAANSDAKLASQKAVKTYVDTNGSSTGWSASTDTWTYVSGTSFTIAGVDRTATFTKGTRLKLTQSGATKYFVVTSATFSTNTTVTITGGTDYSLANAAISSPYYSYAANPQGYPGWFNYTPTYSASGTMTFSTVTTNLARFSVSGNSCSVVVNASGTIGGSTSYGVRFSLPINASNRYSLYGCGLGNPTGASKSLVVSNYNLNDVTTAEISIYDVSNWVAGTRDFSIGADFGI